MTTASSKVARAHAESMPHLMRQHANGFEVDAPARSVVEWLPLSDLESERAHAASAVPARSTYASIRVAVGHAVSGPHPESHNPALDARGIGDAALLQGVVGVARVFDAVFDNLVVGCALLSEVCKGFDAADCEANTELRLGING